jgi:hypothetical membrane protein
MNNRKTLINWLGLLSIVSLASYTAAVVFAPRAYPGYDWLSQAVSDLSAANAPSLMLWNQLSSLYGLCGIVCVMMVCVAVRGSVNKQVRYGIYLFAAMNWVSGVGYSMFPLSDSGYAEKFQDVVHVYVVTPAVVILSIVSLILIIVGGFRKKAFVSLAAWAAAALAAMCAGAIGVGAAPEAYFGLFERFSVFAATAFNAVLGVYLFRGRFGENRESGEIVVES